jgi:hypothetical protein
VRYPLAVKALATAVILVATQLTSAHAASEYPEEAVKAVFLYRFAGYVTWPASAATAPQFTIAVLGADKVAAQLKALLPDHLIQGKPMRVTTIAAVDQVDDDQMLYVGPEFGGKLAALIEALKGRPILVVTDQPGALDAGSMVNFVVEQAHVRFEISTYAAKRSGLLIDAGLLAVAEHIKTGGLLENWSCGPSDEISARCRSHLVGLAHRPGNAAGG